jgi:hypothetical protein
LSWHLNRTGKISKILSSTAGKRTFQREGQAGAQVLVLDWKSLK